MAFWNHSFAYAQDYYKFGPSVLFSYGGFDAIVAGYGGEISYEKAIKERNSFNIGLSANYGSQVNREELLSNQLDQIALFVGGFAEFRIHLEERFNGAFIGFGFDVKYSNTEYISSSTGTSGIITSNRISSTEGNLTFSIGEIFDYDNGKYISPSIKLGVGVFVNEYPVNGQLSLVLGF